MFLLVGLGNPGAKYAGNRHNIGFMVLDAVAREYGFPGWRKRFQGEVSDATISGARVLALKPMTYMNNSGRSVGEAWRFHKIDREKVIVLHDELDLAFGKVRVKVGGGHGGHNGIRDIANQIGPDFVRVRIGIGHPGEKDRVTGHVLKDFAKDEQGDVDKLIHTLSGNLALLLSGEHSGYMNKIALTMNPPKPKPPKPDAQKPAAPETAPPKVNDTGDEDGV